MQKDAKQLLVENIRTLKVMQQKLKANLHTPKEVVQLPVDYIHILKAGWREHRGEVLMQKIRTQKLKANLHTPKVIIR